ncbi:MAG: DUF4406 domain-containing protein [Planctomycetota bacterium]|nr:DUF4406 domain-containing protein [Planctomycetota bacterium]
MTKKRERLWVMIAGPYGSGAATEADRARNLEVMNKAALEVFEKGHVPIIGVNLALPVIEAAGADRYDEIMMPLSLALSERCDAIVRIGGPSEGADAEVHCVKARGGRVYFQVSDLPEA